jgi:hypothetical protein
MTREYSEEHGALRNEVRYAERLCLRTARLYRRAQTLGTFTTIVGGSAAITALSSTLPAWLSVAGFAAAAVFGAVLIAVRPAEKAAANELDAKRYAELRTASNAMDANQLRAALDKLRETYVAEVEPLRDVAFNDVVIEVGHPEMVVRLTPQQRFLAALA